VDCDIEEDTVIISTTDPISLVDVQNPESHPFVVEGEGENALKIYFENEDNKNTYLGIEVEQPEEDIETNPDNPF
jgi:hypothetical protein